MGIGVSRLAAASGWEREAQTAANAVTRGANDVARTLTTAPAATPTAVSQGEPLRAPARERLQEAFGADLEAVRVHQHAEARVLAAATGAQGFAAGAHVYLRDPLDVGRRAELTVLAHEVAHVLQQTGRRLPDVRLRATDVRGAGPVLWDEDGIIRQIARESRFRPDPPTWPELQALYGGLPDLATHVAVIDHYAPEHGPPDVEGLAQAAARLPAGTRPAVIGRYIDRLKSIGADEAASGLLLAHPAVPTAFRSRSTYRHIHDAGVGWLGDCIDPHPFLGRVYPDRIVDAYRTFFFMHARAGLAPVDLALREAAQRAGPHRKRNGGREHATGERSSAIPGATEAT